MFNPKYVCIFLSLLMIFSTSLTVMSNDEYVVHPVEYDTPEEARMTDSGPDRCADHELVENTVVSSPESTLFYDEEAMLWNNTLEISPESGWSGFTDSDATWVWPYVQAPGTYDFIHHFTLQSGAYDVEFHWSGLADNSFIQSSNLDYFTSMQDENTGEYSLVHVSLAGGYSVNTIPYDSTNHPGLASVSNLEYDAGTGILYGTTWDDVNSESVFVSINPSDGLVSSIGTIPNVDSAMSTIGGTKASVSIAADMNHILDLANPYNSSNNFDHYDDIETGMGEIQGVSDSLNLSLMISARNRNTSSGGTTSGGMIYSLDISYCVDPEISDVDGDGVVDSEDVFIWNPYEWSDADHDRIGDNSDICPDTPFGEMSDSDGCSFSQLGIPGVPDIEYLEQPFYVHFLQDYDIEFFPSIEHFYYHPHGDVNITVELNDSESFDDWMEIAGHKEEQRVIEGQTLVEVSDPPEGMLSKRSLTIPVEHVLLSIAEIAGVVSITDTDMIPPPQLTSYVTSDINPNSVRAEDVHRATDSWAAGIDGSGINVAIADTGVDFANPALRGTQARVDDPNSPYDGWPIMYDENGMIKWLGLGQHTNGYVDTSLVDRDDYPASQLPGTLPDGDGILDNEGFTVGFSLSKSGEFHLGLHKLKNVGWVDVLVTDQVTSGVYDTVIVDLNKNHDFTDDYKMMKGDEAGGYAYHGQQDSIWDVSAGMIYWISDGVNGVPYGDVLASRDGYKNRIAGAGDLVLFMQGGHSSGSHGTLCASAVSGQGNLHDGMGQGMAPGAKIIASWDHHTNGVLGTQNAHFFYRGYDGIPNTGDEADIASYSLSSIGNEGRDTVQHLTEFGGTGNKGPFTHNWQKPDHVIMVGGYTSLELENGGGTWGSPWQPSSRYVSPTNFEPNPHVVTVGHYHGDAEALNMGSHNGHMAYNRWHGTSLSSPLAAGIGALAMQAFNEEHGRNPTSSELRDILMSTAQNTGLDTFTQGGGFLDAKRAIDAIRGDNHAILVEPAISTSITIPGEHSSEKFTLSNKGDKEVEVTVTPSELMPLDHRNLTWEMDGAEGTSQVPGFVSGWDGNAAGPIWFNDGGLKYGDMRYPDMIIPIHINADSNNQLPPDTSVVRARAAVSECASTVDICVMRNTLKFIRWTDIDGDGEWMNDELNDGLIINHDSEWTESIDEFSFLDTTLSRHQSITYVSNPLEVGQDGILLAVWRDSGTYPVYCETTEYCSLGIDITAFGYQNSRYLSLNPPETSEGGGSAARSSSSETFQIPANSQHDLTTYLDIPPSTTPDIIQHGVMIHTSGAGIGGSVDNREWFLPIITVVAYDGPFNQEPMIVDHDTEDQKLYTIHWMVGIEDRTDITEPSRRFLVNASGFSPDGTFYGAIWSDDFDISGSLTKKVDSDGLLVGSVNVIDYINGDPMIHDFSSHSMDLPYSSYLHYYGPISKHLEDVDPETTYPHISEHYLGNTDPLHLSTTVSDVSIGSAVAKSMIYQNQEATQDLGVRWNTGTFSWYRPQHLTKGETYEYEIECIDDSYSTLWIVEDNGDGLFDPGTRGAGGTEGDFYNPDMIDSYNYKLRFNHGDQLMVDYYSQIYPNTQLPLNPTHNAGGQYIGSESHFDYRPLDSTYCTAKPIQYQARYSGLHWLAVQGGVAGANTLSLTDGISEFNIIKGYQTSHLSVSNWNVLNPTTTTAPWNADMSGIGNGVVEHVLELEITHQETDDIYYCDKIIAEIVVEMANGYTMKFPYTYHIPNIEPDNTLDPDDVSPPPDDDSVEAVDEEDSGFFGLPGFEAFTMIIVMLVAAFVQRRRYSSG